MIKPYYETDLGKLYHGGCLNILKQMPDESINCVVTSPPYWGLRDYSTAGQIGLEKTPEEYINEMAMVFREVMRVLSDKGTLWLNMGDSYWGGKGQSGQGSPGSQQDRCDRGLSFNSPASHVAGQKLTRPQDGKHRTYKSKDLVGMPWRIAFALQAEGWYLRSDIIWHKPNPMPESVTDRPTKSHEYIFLMSKSGNYYYDSESIKEPASYNTNERVARSKIGQKSTPTERHNGIRPRKLSNAGLGIKNNISFASAMNKMPNVRNKRTVWTVTTKGFSEAHFATYPPNLIIPCIKAGCPADGIVLDPFMGSGTTAIVAEQLNRKWEGIEINQDYCDIAVNRIKKETAQLKLSI